MPEYTILTIVGVIAIVLFELLYTKTRLFHSAQFWIALAIVLSFQVLVDGWLTKLRAPIVMYNDDTFLGVRFPFDIPIEDFGFGFAMITLTLIVWIMLGRRSMKNSLNSQQQEK